MEADRGYTAADQLAVLRARLERWREALPPGDEVLFGTLGPGMAITAISTVGRLLSQAVAMLLPEADVGTRPTFGAYVQAIERHGRDHRLESAGGARRLVTSPEVEVLKRLSRARATIAHLEESPIPEDGQLGHFTAKSMREILELVQAAIDLPLFEELVWWERKELGSAG